MRGILRLACIGVTSVIFAGQLRAADVSAGDILAITEVAGGLVVHLGCGESGAAKLLADLRAGKGYVVHCLDGEPANVERVRRQLGSLGLYGPVSVEQWADLGSLPYADNLVNLLVAGKSARPPAREAMRVLRPGGVAFVEGADSGWTRVTKPWPAEMDGWGHWFHGADGNPVSRDRLVGPPRRLQWTSGPAWARHHASPGTVAAPAASGGRIFYLEDGTPTSVLDGVPDRWSLVARDAFNGVELWRRPMGDWGRFAWGGERFRNPEMRLRHYLLVPQDAQRRLVADGDRLFVPLGYRAPLSVLDGATGSTMHIFEGTERCRIVLCDAGRVYLLRRQGESPDPEIAAYDATSFKPLWRRGGNAFTTVLDLAARDQLLCVVDLFTITALDAATGAVRWRHEAATKDKANILARAVLTDLCVLVTSASDTLQAFSAGEGRPLWSFPMKRMTDHTLQLYVIDGLVWTMSGPTIFAGLDPATGKTVRTIDATNVLTSSHHHRCHGDRATERFFVLGKECVEFVGVNEPLAQVHNWVRGTCQVGVLPANGLLYAPPSPCTCYVHMMLRGFNALAAGREPPPGGAAPVAQRGPAWGRPVDARPAPATDWPTFRHDPARSGTTGQNVGLPLVRTWQTDLGGKPTAPVVAHGRVLAASVNAHTVHCLDAGSGARLWSFTAGGRIDSPPTIEGGRAIFGCADGWVYCLRLDNGALIWRLRAAPSDRRVMADGQLESAWPVHGSVLVSKGTAYVAAGRSSRLDGGVRVLAIDPGSGTVLRAATFDTPEPTAPLKDNLGPDERKGFLTDIMVADGDDVWMRTMKFTPALEAQEVRFVGGIGGDLLIPSRGTPRLPHLTAVSGFLDDQYFSRVFWAFKGVFGQILCVDREMVYGLRAYDHTGFSVSYRPGSGYILFGETHQGRKAMNLPPVNPPKDSRADHTELSLPHPLPSNRWTKRCDIRAAAMVLAGRTLVVAGPPDAVDPKQPYAAFEGRGPAKLRLVSCEDGVTLGEVALDCPPVWNGMAIAGGRLYLATADGKVLCLSAGPDARRQGNDGRQGHGVGPRAGAGAGGAGSRGGSGPLSTGP